MDPYDGQNCHFHITQFFQFLGKVQVYQSFHFYIWNGNTYDLTDLLVFI